MSTVEWPSQAAVTPFGSHNSGLGVNLGLRTARPVSAIRPRTIRAPNWSEQPAQTPTAPSDPIVKNRRRENLLLYFFNCKTPDYKIKRSAYHRFSLRQEGKSDCFHKKIQAPTSNIQRRSSFQIPIPTWRSMHFGAWKLDLLWMLEVGAWMFPRCWILVPGCCCFSARLLVT